MYIILSSCYCNSRYCNVIMFASVDSSQLKLNSIFVVNHINVF